MREKDPNQAHRKHSEQGQRRCKERHEGDQGRERQTTGSQTQMILSKAFPQYGPSGAPGAKNRELLNQNYRSSSCPHHAIQTK
jgi:hypothetical protein